MTKAKTFFQNKRAISTLFVAVYIVIITVVLLSALFIGLTISNSGILSYQRDQEDRNQEKIVLSSLSVNPQTNTIDTLTVNNTGGITVRIRALYLDKTFVCDPSTLSGTDSYIAPQSSLSIQLSSKNIYANSSTMMANWTVTTERGISTSETGANLWIGSQEQLNDPEKVYYGPICLYFSQFQWSNNGGASWHLGWTIPETPGDVIWRINITNIDNRPIILDGNSSFSLIQNSQQPNKIAKWDIGPTSLNPPNLRLEPDRNYSICFSLNGPNSLSYMSTPIPISSNFLTIIGKFIQPGGGFQSFAQTIPFEAVLITNQPQIPTKITLDPISSAQTCFAPITVSGRISNTNTTDKIPKGSIVIIQYAPVGVEDWTNIYPQLKTTEQNGGYSDAVAFPHTGTYQVRALFVGTDGSPLFAASWSANQTVTVSKSPTATTLNIVSPITIGQSTTLTASVSPSQAPGTINFEICTDNSNTFTLLGSSTLNAGTATYTYTPPAPGSNYQFRAVYPESLDALTSTSTVRTLTVNKATPSLSTPTLNPPSPITLGNSVTASITFTGVSGVNPTGQITFQTSTDGGAHWTYLCDKPVGSNPITSDPYTAQTLGTQYQIKANYAGDTNYNSASSTVTFAVKATPVISLALTPSSPVAYGTPVTATATATGSYGTPTGNVQFQISTDAGVNFSNLGAPKPLSAGSATSTAYTAPSVGTNYQFRAIYAGDTSYLSATGAAVLSVNKAPTTTTVSFSAMPAGQQYRVTASVTGPTGPTALTGTVSFEISTNGVDFSPLGNPVITNSGTGISDLFSLTAPNDYTIKATYNGDTNYQKSTSSPSKLYLVSFTQSGVGADFTGTVIQLGSNSYGQSGYAAWYAEGTNLVFTYQSALTVGSKQYMLTGVNTASPLVVNGPAAVSATYKTQFKVTFDASSNVKSDSSAVIVTVDGVNKLAGELPFTTGWIDGSSQLTFVYQSPLSSATSPLDAQYTWGSTTGLYQTLQSNTFTVNAGGTITGSYGKQLKVTFDASSNVKSDCSSAIIKVDGVSLTAADLPFTTDWLNSGTAISFEYTSPITSVSAPADTRYTWISTDGLSQTSQANTLTATNPGTITANYAKQFQVSFSQSGITNDAGSNTVLTIGLLNYAYDALPTNLWVDSGTVFSWSQTISGATGQRFSFTSTTGLTNPIISSGTSTAVYSMQYAVTFEQSGLGIDAASTVLTVNGIDKTLSDLPLTVWVDPSIGSISYGYSSTVSGGSNSQYIKTSSDPPITGISGPLTVVGTYKGQFKITFDASSNVKSDSSTLIVTVGGVDKAAGDLPFTTDWIDSGTSLSFAYQSPIASTNSPSDTRYGWTTIGGLGQTLQSNAFIVTAPGTVISTYIKQYQISALYSVSDISTPTSSVILSGTASGLASTTSLSAITQTVWLDENTVWSINNPITAGSGVERWNTASGATGTVTGPIAINPLYYHQYRQLLSYSVIAGGSPTPATATGTALGAIYAPSLTLTPTAYWFDASGSITFGSVAGGVGERWVPSPSSISGMSAHTQAVTMYHQYRQTLNYVVAYGGMPSAPTATGTSLGVAYVPTLTTSALDYWFDAAGSIAISTPIGSAGEQWAPTQTTLSAASSHTQPVTIAHQYQVTFAVTPTNYGTISPAGTSWYNAGSTISITANGSNGYKLTQWSAIGSITIANPTAAQTTATINGSGTITASLSK